MQASNLDPHEELDVASDNSESECTDFEGDGSYPVSKEQQEEIAKEEDKAIYRLRVLVLGVLLFSTIAVSMATYYFLSGSEKDQFEGQFQSDANKVLDGIGKTLDDTFGATDAFITKAMSYARYSNSTWPFVTVPDVALQRSKLLRISKAFHMTTSHLVEPEQLEEWQEYAAANLGWIQDSLQIQRTDTEWRIPVTDDFTTSYEVLGFGGPVSEPMPYENNYMPTWQQGPLLSGPQPPLQYNWDGWTLPGIAEAMHHSYKHNRIALTQLFGNIVTDPEDPIQVISAEGAQTWSSQFIAESESEAEPTAFVSFPMIDKLDSVEVDPDTEQPIVGFLVFALFYRDLFKDILPSNSNGIILVMEHSCGNGQAFTYQLDGAKTIYLGEGDLHDESYDELGYSATLGELVGSSSSDRSSHYSGLPLADDFCTKTVKIYPSKTMENNFTTNKPIIFTCLAVLIFMFTSFVFFAYDWLVGRRQNIVMTRALASGAIVSSLFPEQVRKQLYAEKKEEQTQQDHGDKFLKSNTEATAGPTPSRPIADHYEETTIFFMDLAGFTKWSSSRTPTEVFELLEALYGAFDAIAARRGVFKVETIGDCYMAGMVHFAT